MRIPMRATTSRNKVRRSALLATVIAVVCLGVAAMLVLRQPATHAQPGAGCDIPANQQSSTCSYKGLTANADFESFSDDGCIETSVFVLASEGITRNPGLATSDGNGVSISISQFDNCNNVALVDAIGFTNGVSFVAAHTLDTATLDATVTVTDYASADLNSFPIALNLTWRGYGPTVQSIDSTHQRGASWTINTRFHGDSRSAQVSGVVSDGTTNYAASPTMFGTLEDAQGGMEYIQR